MIHFYLWVVESNRLIEHDEKSTGRAVEKYRRSMLALSCTANLIHYYSKANC